MTARTRCGPMAVLACLCASCGGPSHPNVTALEIVPENAKAMDELGGYPDLQRLTIHCLEELPALPDSIGQLTKLKELVIDNGNGCSMNPLLPSSLGSLRSLERLVLYGAQDPGETAAPGQRHPLPASMAELKNLRSLDLGRNGYSEIPAFVGKLTQLKELRFAANSLKSIPPFIADLHELTTLALDGNELEDLPDFLNSLPELSVITLGDNCKITQNKAKMSGLARRFPRVKFNFEDEFDCPGQ